MVKIIEPDPNLIPADDVEDDPRGEGACPECPEGEKVPIRFGSLGVTAWECSAGCGWQEHR